MYYSSKCTYDANGNPSQAAMGFARKFNADVNSLYKIEEAGQEYVALKVCEKGKSLTEIIPNIIADCVLKVQGSHFMRWAEFDEKLLEGLKSNQSEYAKNNPVLAKLNLTEKEKELVSLYHEELVSYLLEKDK